MSKKRAFTMVELIFVIVILGILAAVAVPRLNASREDAQIAVFKANLATALKDIETYYLANGELLNDDTKHEKNEDFVDLSKISNVPFMKNFRGGMPFTYITVDDERCISIRVLKGSSTAGTIKTDDGEVIEVPNDVTYVYLKLVWMAKPNTVCGKIREEKLLEDMRGMLYGLKYTLPGSPTVNFVDYRRGEITKIYEIK